MVVASTKLCRLLCLCLCLLLCLCACLCLRICLCLCLCLRLCLCWCDVQVAKVYVSVYSDEAGKEQAINNLRRVAP
jgi:hypothetical protein